MIVPLILYIGEKTKPRLNPDEALYIHFTKTQLK